MYQLVDGGHATNSSNGRPKPDNALYLPGIGRYQRGLASRLTRGTFGKGWSLLEPILPEGHWPTKILAETNPRAADLKVQRRPSCGDGQTFTDLRGAVEPQPVSEFLSHSS